MHDSKIVALALTNNIPIADLNKQVESDKDGIRELGFELDMLSPHEINEDGNIVYRITLADVTNDIVVSVDCNGNYVFDVYEDDIHNELKIVDGVGLYLDGVLVQRERQYIDLSSADTLSEESIFETNSVDSQTRARFDLWSSDPIHPDSIYSSTSSGVYQASKVSWGLETLIGVAVTAVTAIILWAIQNYIEAVDVTSSVLVSIFSLFAQEMITNCEVYGMNDEYFSFSFFKYSCTNDWPLEYTCKYTGYCYSERDYQGIAYPHTMYYLNGFS